MLLLKHFIPQIIVVKIILAKLRFVSSEADTLLTQLLLDYILTNFEKHYYSHQISPNNFTCWMPWTHM